jgi:hypothetical protein
MFDCRFPIADFIIAARFRTFDRQSSIEKSAMKSPALLTTRSFQQNYWTVERLAELFSGLFYVAASRLNSPRFSTAIEPSTIAPVNVARASCP